MYSSLFFAPSPTTLKNRLYGSMDSSADHKPTMTLPQDRQLDLLKQAKEEVEKIPETNYYPQAVTSYGYFHMLGFRSMFLKKLTKQLLMEF